MNAVDKVLALFDRVESAEFFARDFGARLKQSEARVKELEADLNTKALPSGQVRMCSEVDETVVSDPRPSVLSVHACGCATWEGAACDCAVALLAKAKAELEDMRISRDGYADMRDEARMDASRHFEELQDALREHLIRKRDLDKALEWSNKEPERIAAAVAQTRELIIAFFATSRRYSIVKFGVNGELIPTSLEASEIREALGFRP